MACSTLSRAALVALPLLVACGPELSRSEDLQGGGGTNIRQGDACKKQYAVVGCGEDQASFRFCDRAMQTGSKMAWGPCVEAPACLPGDSDNCAWGGAMSCELYLGTPYWDDSGCSQDPGDNTPLVVVFDERPVEYAPVSMASFDTFAGGCQSHDWPTAASPWLVLDRDGSGFIEDGRELFGSGTELRDGRRARNGFEALAELDENRDGFITRADPAYDRLMVWQDVDADRISRPGELVPVSSLGLDRLEVGYAEQPRCDARGNCEIERAAADTTRGRAASIVDIHLACH